MGQFISWIESKGQNYFLTDKDVNSEKWSEVNKNPLPDFALSHKAIRQYYNLGSSDLEYHKNETFWNGKIPDEIKGEWNSGNLDGMLKFFEKKDIENIARNTLDDTVNRIPEEFSFWIIKNKFDNPRDLIKSSFWIYRLAGFLASRDYEAMTQDRESSRINFIGASILEDPELIMRSIDRKLFQNEDDNYNAIRLGTRRKYSTMIRDRKSAAMRLIAQSITKDYESMIYDKYPWSRFVGVIGTIYDREEPLIIERPIF